MGQAQKSQADAHRPDEEEASIEGVEGPDQIPGRLEDRSRAAGEEAENRHPSGEVAL